MLPALFEHAFQFMGVLDPDGRVLTANRASLGVIGCRAEDVLGQPFWETPWWSHDREVQARIQEAATRAARGEFVRFEATHLDQSGALRWVDFSLTPFRGEDGAVRWLFPEGRDITPQKSAELALRESEEKFRQIFQRSQDGILLLDGDTFVDCNQATLEMMRCSQPELLRMHPWELSPPVQPDGRPSGEKALEMIRLAHARGGHRFEWVHRRSDGEDFPVEVTLTPFPLRGREVLYTTWRDITERKREERERLDLERRVLHAQKLESLGILAGGIAHDFNNMLTAMLGRLELAGEACPPGHPAAEHLRILDDILARATDLTRQMLAYSGKGRFVVGPTDLSRLVDDMSKLLASSVPKKVALAMDLASGLPMVEGDIAQLQQVLLNLVTNAADAIGDQPGRIRIATGLEPLDATAVSALRAEVPPAPGPYVFLEVDDTGCGIPEEVQARIFEPFFSTKDAGRGLGLSALLGILRAHRGALRMDSTPGGGTTFRLYFPASGAPAPAPSGNTPSGGTFRPGLRILVVDDEDSIREATRSLLARMGFEVETAFDGIDALEKVRSGPPFALALVDLMMPRLDGRQTLEVLAREQPALPVVLCSGYSAQEIPGWDGVFLAKPYSRDALEQALREAYQKRKRR